MGFSLLSGSLPFCYFFTLLSPPPYSHYWYTFFDIYNPSLPRSPSKSRTYRFPLFLLGVLLSSICITWPSQAILLLFINLTPSAFSRSVCNSFWFSRIHLNFALGKDFFFNILLSNILRCCSFRFVSVQASHPYVTYAAADLQIYDWAWFLTECNVHKKPCWYPKILVCFY
jgi:hypothetical protein